VRADVITSADGGDSLEVIDKNGGVSLCVSGTNAGTGGQSEFVFCELGSMSDSRIKVFDRGTLALIEVDTGLESDEFRWTIGNDGNGNVFFQDYQLTSDPPGGSGPNPNKDDESKYFTPRDVSDQVFQFLPAGKSAPVSVFISSDADSTPDVPEPSYALLSAISLMVLFTLRTYLKSLR
jgi:hypothetical protein